MLSHTHYGVLFQFTANETVWSHVTVTAGALMHWCRFTFLSLLTFNIRLKRTTEAGCLCFIMFTLLNCHKIYVIHFSCTYSIRFILIHFCMRILIYTHVLSMCPFTLICPFLFLFLFLTLNINLSRKIAQNPNLVCLHLTDLIQKSLSLVIKWHFI